MRANTRTSSRAYLGDAKILQEETDQSANMTPADVFNNLGASLRQYANLSGCHAHLYAKGGTSCFKYKCVGCFFEWENVAVLLMFGSCTAGKGSVSIEAFGVGFTRLLVLDSRMYGDVWLGRGDIGLTSDGRKSCIFGLPRSF